MAFDSADAESLRIATYALADAPLRHLLVRRLGERVFTLVYTAIAALTLMLLAAVARQFKLSTAARR